MTKLFQIDAPHFNAGFCVDAKNTIWRTAPIIKWMEDRPLYVAESYCRKRGWKLSELTKEEGKPAENPAEEVSADSEQVVVEGTEAA